MSSLKAVLQELTPEEVRAKLIPQAGKTATTAPESGAAWLAEQQHSRNNTEDNAAVVQTQRVTRRKVARQVSQK